MPPSSQDASRSVPRVISASARSAALRIEDNADDDAPAGKDWSADVLRVREWLRGRRIVVVGGERREDAVRRFIDAFSLEGVDWVSLTEHSSSAPLQAPIARKDTALVATIIRLSGHQHIDDARRFASKAGKPCINLTGGYNPEQLARAELEQASAQLAGIETPANASHAGWD